jgi:hypothetical protein
MFPGPEKLHKRTVGSNPVRSINEALRTGGPIGSGSPYLEGASLQHGFDLQDGC